MTFLERWNDVDARALRLGISLNDERRLIAAVNEALAARFRAGHMASPAPLVRQLVRRLLSPWNGDPSQAVDLAIARGRTVMPERDVLQSRACRFMEDEIARFITERIRREMPPPNDKLIADAIAKVEHKTGHHLSAAQRQAVLMATSCGVCLISGGAGTGKTTVVRTILAAFEALRDALSAPQQKIQEYLQVALAGRAVRVDAFMTETQFHIGR